MDDVLIIGSGPAGISAALYTARANLKTAVISKDKSPLVKSEKIENYYGFAQPVSGETLINNGLEQAKRFGVRMVDAEVVSIGYDGDFVVETATGEIKGKSVIIATGSNRTAPRIKDFHRFEGKGISYCATCDAFFYKGKDVAVLGCCDYALHEAQELLPIAKSVTLVTNGTELKANFPKEIAIIPNKIETFKGEQALQSIAFSDREPLEVAGVFVAIGVAGSSDLAKKLGAQTEGLRIVVDEYMATTVPGLFAAGDCTGGQLQIAKAVCEGAKAGTAAIKYIRAHTHQ